MIFRYCYILFLFLSLSVDVSAQYVRRETVKDREYAVFYASGMVESSQWPAGRELTRDGATIRHQVAKGNGGNPSVNDRVSVRFIIAPSDLAASTWAAAAGFPDAGSNLETAFSGSPSGGCAGYGATADGGGRKWRVPTQRELMLLWLYRDAVNTVYPSGPIGKEAGSTAYWSSTEQDAGNAWYFDFDKRTLKCDSQSKSTPCRVRCVSDY